MGLWTRACLARFRILNAEQIESLRLPELSAAGVEIYLPPLKELRSIVERMRGISSHMELVADLAGNLTVTFQTPLLSTTTRFKNLHHPAGDGGRQPFQPDPDTKTECRVDIKRFWSFLQCSILSPRSVLCCFVENVALVLRVQTFDEGNLVFYIPCLT